MPSANELFAAVEALRDDLRRAMGQAVRIARHEGLTYKQICDRLGIGHQKAVDLQFEAIQDANEAIGIPRVNGGKPEVYTTSEVLKLLRGR